MKPLFICDRIDQATLTASAGTDAAYPLTNLQDGRFATQWKSGGTTAGQTLTITHAAPFEPNYVLIINHNLASLGLTSLSVKDSADNEVTSISEYPAVIFIEIAVGSYYDTAHKLKFNKGSALSAAPQIGMIFIGRKVELSGIVNNPKTGFSTVTDVDESLSGLTFATQLIAGKYTRKFVPSGLSAAEEVEFNRLLNTISNRLHPFFFRDTDGNWNFVRLGQDSVESAQWSKVKSFPQELLMIGELPGVQFIS